MSKTQQEQRGARHLNDARNARFETTGEPSTAGNHDDAVRERVVSGSSGSKSGHKKPVVSQQQEVASVKGHHNGRPHPPKFVMGGDENDHGENGGTLDAQNAKRS